MKKQYTNIIQDLNVNIEVYLTDSEIKVSLLKIWFFTEICNCKNFLQNTDKRKPENVYYVDYLLVEIASAKLNNAGPGIWLSLLLPIAVLLGFWKHLNCSDVYKTAVCVSCGLLISSTTFIYFINYTTRLRTICCALNSAITTLLLIYFSHGGIILSLGFGVLSSFGYNRLLLFTLQTCPQSFSFGEAATVVQSAILFVVASLANLTSILSPPTDCMAIAMCILQVGLIGISVLCIATYTYPQLCKSNNFYTLAAGLLSLVALFLHYYFLQQSPVLWLLLLCTQDIFTIKLLFSWLLLSGLAVIAVTLQVRGKKKASTIVRKYFHLLALATYIPGLLLNQCLLYTASGMVFALFIILETLRVLKLPPLGAGLHAGFQAFVDEKDTIIALTPIYLLVGCSAPLWLHPKPSEHVLLPLLAGLLSVGVGDTAASMCGTWCGRRKWPGSERTKEGTMACFLSQLFVVLVFIHFGYIPRTNLLQPILAILVTSLVEAFTDQVDNLALSLLSYILLL